MAERTTRGLVARAATLAGEVGERLRRLMAVLQTAPGWDVPTLDQLIHQFAAAEGVGIGKFGPALRGVLSGGAPAPGLAETLAALGRDEAMGRLADALGPTA